MEDDKILYQEFLDGSNKSLEKIIDKYLESLIYFIFGYVKNIDVAQDLAQDVFLYILVNRENYDFNYSLKTYLFLIAKSRAINFLKSYSNNNLVSIEEYQNIENAEIIEEVVFSSIKNKNIKNAINQLPPKQAKCIYLAKIEDMKIKDIAQILELTESDVKSSIRRGIKKLKKIIGKEDDLYV